MEDDKGKERPAKAQEPKAEEEKPEAPAGKGLPKKAILIAGGVIVLLILAAVAYFVFAPSTQASTEDGATEAVNVDTQDGVEADVPAERTSRSTRSSKRGSEEDTASTNIFMTDFPASVVNLGPSEKYDYVYLKYGFTLELDNEKVRSEIAMQLPKLISVVDGEMSGNQWDKICNSRGRDALANDIAEAINTHLKTGRVIAVHFNTFVAQ